ncbi:MULTISPECIES: C40 family peptidase [unclassified Streptomyces]|uniref:C40 family peptidase n=1 Tax=Streptomyces sp. NBC_00060 TaxID=2975636 RepID=A0AAU2GX14_9ACTN
MQPPEFTDATPADCTCSACLGNRRAGRTDTSADRRPRVRGAVVAAVGAAVLVGTAAGTASAEPAPSHAGWDGSKYWYKDATGWWRWTSHYDKYVERAGGSSTGGTSPRSPSAKEPTFRGHAGWDATDRVYWYQKGGQWWWTSHQSKYARNTGGSGGSSGSSTSSGSASSSSGTGSGTPSRHGTEAAIAYAMAHLGDPYVWGGDGPHGWDCSGLVQAAYRQAGITLPRVADDQYRATTPIPRDQLRRGDLVFWSTTGGASGIHHVAIYLGNSQYLEAPRPGKNVRVSTFDWYNPNMYGRLR